MIPNPQAVLQFGSLELARGDASTPYSLFAAGDDGSWGNPDPVIAVVDSLLGDGQLASVVRHNNREAQFGITVSAADGTALAAAEAALVAETEKQNVLIWSAPDGYAPTTVFDVVTSWLEHVFDDVEELQLQRRYVLHLTLFPSSRSSTSTVVEAVGSGVDPTDPPTEVLVSDCSSLTNWTARTYSGIDPLTLNSGHLYLAGDIGRNLWMKYDVPGAADWHTTPYVVVDWKATSSYDPSFTLAAFVDGTLITAFSDQELNLVSTGPSPMGGTWRRSTFKLFSSSSLARVDKVRFHMSNDLSAPSGARWALWLANVMVTDGGAANDGTTRQLSRSLEIAGSARALGAIDVRHASALGDVLVWSGPSACSPPLRRLRASGAGETVDTSLVSGAYEDIGTTAFAADLPLSTVPAGAYLVMARLKTTSADGAYTVDVTAQTRLATSVFVNTPVGPVLAIDDARVDLTSSYQICALGVLHLPAAEVASGSDGVLRLTLQGTSVRLDEAWLFNITDGDLTFVKGADKVLRITSPTLLDPRWRVWTGPTDAAMYDAGSKMELRGQHLFAPGSWSAFTVTTNAQDAAVSLTYDKRWHTHAGEDG